MSTLDTRPTRLGTSIAVGFSGLAVIATAVVPASLVLSLLGLVLVGFGTARGTESLVMVGAGGLTCAVLVAGLAGSGPVSLLVATAGTVLAWDTGMQAIDLGATLGRAADTTRALFVHVAASTILATAIAGVGYAVYRIVGGGHPVTALVLLLFGAVVLAAAFR